MAEWLREEFFDISQRGKIDREILSYTIPCAMYLEMESGVDASFLRLDVWQKLCRRW